MGTEKGQDLALLLCWKQFKETRNPLHVMSGFHLACTFGKTPPKWVVDYIDDVFIRYAESKGRVSLDRLFGLSRGKGRSPAIKESDRQHRESIAMLDICTLKNLFGLTTSEAADMVASRDYPDDEEMSVSTTLADTYSRRSWQRRFRSDPYWSFMLSVNLAKDKINYLRQFPREYWPHRLRKLHPGK